MAGKLGSVRRADEELETWVSDVIPRAVAYARTLLTRYSDAEDLVHDVLCRLMAHREYDLIADGEKLLFRSITNACINRQTRRREVLSLDAGRENGVHLSAFLRAENTPDPADVASAAELSEAVRRGLAALPAMQRAAIELKSMQYTLKEIAHMLDVSASNAGVLIHRARRRLAERLGPMLGGALGRTRNGNE